MAKLDSELEVCRDTSKYPPRVRRLAMHLNRAVCLLYPEYQIPWFHGEYCQEQVLTDVFVY